MQNLEEIQSNAEREFAACGNLADLEQAKSRFLGKSGALTEQLKQLGKLPAEERPAAGGAINLVKQAVEHALQTRREAILLAEQEQKLASETLDVTLPGRGRGQPAPHLP